MRRVAVERKGETNFFTSQMIKDCMKKVKAVNLHQVIKIDDELEIKAYYAGHVLGAVNGLGGHHERDVRASVSV